MEQSSDGVLSGPNSLLQYSSAPLLLLWKPQSGHDPLEIIGSIILDLDSPALLSVMDRHMGGQMLLQPVL